MSDEINILISAIGGGGHGEQILKALKLANDRRYRIFGADINENCPQFIDVDEAFQIPPANHPEFCEVVIDICKRYEISALFHGCEPELSVYSRNRALFKRNGIFLPINKQSTIEKCLDKVKTNEFLASINVLAPKCISVKDYYEVQDPALFPMVMKPSVGSGGSKNCFIAQNKQELKALLKFLEANDEHPIMLQEYVGHEESEYTVGILHDMDGNYINSIAIKRELKSGLNIKYSVANLSGKPELGKNLVISSGISMGLVQKNEEVLTICKLIAKKLDVRGAINIQGRLTSKGFMVFEINPRFSGTTSIRALMGYNEPDVLLKKHMFNEKIEVDFRYKEGMVIRTLKETELTAVDVIKWVS